MKRLLLFALLSCWLPFAYGEDVPTSLIKRDSCGFYAVLHINGVDTDIDGARVNRDRLAFYYGNAHDGHRIRYGLGYNRTIVQSIDIVQAMVQTLAEFDAGGDGFLDWIRAVFRGIFPDWFPADRLAAITARVAELFNARRPDNFYDPDLNYIVNDVYILNFKHRDARLLIVGHSQGSIYANILYRKLIAPAADAMLPGQIGLMSIANFVPLPLAGTGSLYVTNEYDRPVNMARVSYSDIPAHTVTIPHTEDWGSMWRGHNLINKYLADETSRAQILEKMGLVLSGLGARGPFQVETQYYAYQFYGQAGWVDCTFPPGTPGRPSQCGYDNHTTMTVWSQVANTVPTPLRPGERGEVFDLAMAHLNSCLPLVAEMWTAHRQGQPIPGYFNWWEGGYANCGGAGSTLLNRYDYYIGADYWQQFVQPTYTTNYLGQEVAGATAIYSRPTCRRA